MRVRFAALALILFGVMYIGYQQITAQNLVTCPGLVQKAIELGGQQLRGSATQQRMLRLQQR